jgi:hypothetical protein
VILLDEPDDQRWMGQPELAAPTSRTPMPAICQQVVSSDSARCLAPHHGPLYRYFPEQR